jgi:hypothetical protein
MYVSENISNAMASMEKALTALANLSSQGRLFSAT